MSGDIVEEDGYIENIITGEPLYYTNIPYMMAI